MIICLCICDIDGEKKPHLRSLGDHEDLVIDPEPTSRTLRKRFSFHFDDSTLFNRPIFVGPRLLRSLGLFPIKWVDIHVCPRAGEYTA